ncbi:MAG: hypothetical protein NTX64_12545 [Elusimicrobia bacterium]|nr:hypothetical protein [Elusimicrobiota bacterium]
MVRVLKQGVAATLAAALVVLSPGATSRQAWAQVVEAAAAPAIVVPVTPVAPLLLPAPAASMALALQPSGVGIALTPALLPAGAGLALTPALPRFAGEGGRTVALGNVKLAASAAPVPATIAQAAQASGARTEARALAVSKEIEAAGPVSRASGEEASSLGERVLAALAGSAARTDLPTLAAADAERAPAALAGSRSAASLAPVSAAPRSPRAAPVAPKLRPAWDGLSHRAGYGFSRRTLARLAITFGLAFSLPVASHALASRILRHAAAKRHVFSDYDDTLDKFAGVASPETVAAITSVLKAGKTVVVITDRPDTKKPGSKSVTILESLESIPAADRAGLWVAANKGGRILRYDSDGQPRLVQEEPALEPPVVQAVRGAADAVKARLAGLGAELHDGSQNIPSESASPYGYAIMLKAGTEEAAVKRVAAAFQEELKSRGVDYEVEPRLAKDAALPPYVTFSKLDKSLAVRRVAALVGATAADSLILGDSMFAPKPRAVSDAHKRLIGAARRLGERLSGQPEPATGNGTDRDMERALPGALTLSVGGTADPGMKNAFVMPVKGPEMTRRILASVAAGVSR